jgi:hypothetical protein
MCRLGVFRLEPSSSTSFVLRVRLLPFLASSSFVPAESHDLSWGFRPRSCGPHVLGRYFRRGGLLPGEFRRRRRQIRRLKNGNDGWLPREATWLRATRFRSEVHRLEAAASVAETRNPRHSESDNKIRRGSRQIAPSLHLRQALLAHLKSTL